MMNKNEKYLIIYHKEDNDGLFSMAIIYNYLKKEVGVTDTNIGLYGADYNMLESFDIEQARKDFTYIIMTDISFDTSDKIIKLKELFGNNFMWFDHHKPIIEKSHTEHFDDINGLRTIAHSALYNAFTYLYNFVGIIPDIFKVLSAWDSWSYEAENIDFNYCRCVNIGVNNKYDLDVKKIIKFVEDIIYHMTDEQLKEDISELFALGKTECNIVDRENKNLITNFGDLTWTVNNRSACAVFIQKPTNSQVFTSCKDKVKNGIVFKRLTDGKWTVSLYNTDNQHDFHCGEYLREHYNGGGHEGAAGCQISEELFIKILKEKKL